jgi:hypothetical protein
MLNVVMLSVVMLNVVTSFTEMAQHSLALSLIIISYYIPYTWSKIDKTWA